MKRAATKDDQDSTKRSKGVPADDGSDYDEFNDADETTPSSKSNQS